MFPQVTHPADIRNLLDQLDAQARDAESLVAGLSADEGAQRPEGEGWSVAECLDHLATGNRVYLRAMEEPAARARARGRMRSRPASAGWIGGWFARTLEPPPRPFFKLKAPKKIRPRQSPPLADAFAGFMEAQANVRAFLEANAGIDLARIRFPNPFIRGVRFSLATGFHVMAAHNRRHLWQAWRVRQALLAKRLP